MSKIVLLLCMISAVLSASLFEKNVHVIQAQADSDPDWWKHTVYYQIYPRSFKDSDGDGVGDIRGIIEKLDHLKDAGIGATWLSPIFKSPMKDFGYDVSDFREVDPIFGTNADLIELFEKAHELGIKVILDFVPNHSSDSHEWFQKSIQRDGKYADYYVWHDGKTNPDDPEGRNLPPNNWISVFSGSAWTYNDERGQYYLHQFVPGQPDLNYRNDDVVQEMADVFEYWLEQGADGFRIDAINHMFEDPEFQDEPATEGYEGELDRHGSLQHIYTMDLPETYDIVESWRQIMDNFVVENPEESTKVIMTEAWTTLERTNQWYGTLENPISHMPFNFALISNLGSTSTAADFKQVIDERMSNKPSWATMNWVQGNHDTSRIASRYSANQIDALNMLALTLPGIAVTYNGEEIGMEDNTDISWEDTQDPAACQTGDPNSIGLSRDPERTPFQWDDTISAGFSTSENPWLPVHKDYVTLNLKAQKAADRSHFKLYKQLVELRNKEEFRNGAFQSVVQDNVLIYTRSVGTSMYGVAINFKNGPATVDLSQIEGFSVDGLVGQIIALSTNSYKTVGGLLDLKNINFDAYEAGIIYFTPLVEVPPVDGTDSNWWKESVFYQIYPRSFKDSNGDGVGDIRGIIEKLDHLTDAGIGATWLSPIFKSPMKDFGYDISDFREVDPIFGTNADLSELFEKSHELGIKVILDFVPNHSSDQHEWFQKSIQRDGKYADYYVWHDGKTNPDDPEGRNLPPNNWISVFSGSAWTFNEERGQYYLHQFAPGQPDLNYRNDDVIQEMADVFKYWLEQGADGFRIDAINFMFEDPEIRDEPATEEYEGELDRYDSLQHIYTKDLPETYDIVKSWRQIMDNFVAENPEESTKVIMTEAWTTLEHTNQWYGTLENPISHMPFNFALISDLESTSTAADFKQVIDERMSNKPSWATMNWVQGNHDTSRIASRYSANQIDALNMLALTLPGIAVTYNGEEIGMEDNTDISWDDTQDPAACQTGDPNSIGLSRDPERTPFQWDDTISAGFSTSENPWLPVHKDYVTLNLKAQKAADRSHFKLYKQLVELRNIEEFRNGAFQSAVQNNVLIYIRYVGDSAYGVAINFNNGPATVDLSQIEGFSVDGLVGQIIALSTNSYKTVGGELDLKNMNFEAYEAGIIYFTNSVEVPPVDETDADWWKKSVFYQIYPRSFKDSNGDGVGDIRGIIEKLDHLKDAGIGATWLSPIFKSPMKDFGYDISDFREVDPIFGTTADLKELFVKAHALGIKIILDFVPNHTSDQHEWFQKSIKRDGKYANYYMWHDGKVDTENPTGRNLPPNNWISVFSGSAWTYNEERQQYYLHQFVPEQPDLNYRNDDVIQEMADVFKYWLEQGADGFRIDAINHMFEDPEFRDEPATEGYEGELDRHGSLQHIYSMDLPETYEVVKSWRVMMDEFVAANPEHTTKVILTEAWTTLERTLQWYGTEESPISHIPFNFALLTDLDRESTAADFKRVIDDRLKDIPDWAVPNWVQGNHDRNRVASRYTPQQIDALNTLVMTLPGVAVTYNGEEIGMEDNTDITWDETVDPQACQTGDPSSIGLSRDPERTPFQWDDTTSAGFSTSADTWLPVHKDYITNNLKKQKTAARSHFKYYQSLTALRTDDVFRFGDCHSIAENNVLLYSRTFENKTYAVAISFDNEEKNIDISKVEGASRYTNTKAEIILATAEDAVIGNVFGAGEITMQPYEAIVLELSSSSAGLTVSFIVLLIAALIRLF